MKIFNKMGLALVLALSLGSSCDDNDEIGPIIPGPPVGVEIKYEVVVPVDMITEISYRLGDGDTFYGSFGPDDSHLQWDKLSVVLFSNMPETAYLEVKCRNTGTTSQNCTLNIYREDELIETKNALISPVDDDPLTDDIVTTSTSVVIDE